MSDAKKITWTNTGLQLNQFENVVCNMVAILFKAEYVDMSCIIVMI